MITRDNYGPISRFSSNIFPPAGSQNSGVFSIGYEFKVVVDSTESEADPLKCHFSYRLALGEHGFPFQDRFPGFDIFVIDAFRAASDRVNREFVEYSEYARGDPVANACEMAQTLAR